MDGAAISGVLPEGAYYLLEKQAPKGFQVNPERIYFSLKTGETKEMTLTNAPEETEEPASGYVKIIKILEGTGTRLSGAVFGLFKQGSDEKLAELTTGADGTATSAALLAGNYYLLELKAPTGMTLKTDKVYFSLTAGETKEITVMNSLEVSAEPTGNLHLTKKAEITGTPLSGAVFGVYNALTNVKGTEITTAADGTAVCALPEGSYYLLELKAPTGYALEPAQIPFEVTVNATVKVEVTNMTEKGGIRLTVKDAAGSALEGAVFGVYNAADTKVNELTTSRDGKALADLPSGVYYLMEQKTPTGYAAGNDRYSFFVTAGQTVDVLVLKQKSAGPFIIPKTGETFPWLNYGVAALCLCLAAVLGLSIARARKRG